MILKIPPLSALSDFRKFKNITAERQKHFDSAPSLPVRSEYGANSLAKALHPDRQVATVIHATILGNDSVLVCKNDNNFPVLYRDGQYVNILINNHPVPAFFFHLLSDEPEDNPTDETQYDPTDETKNLYILAVRGYTSFFERQTLTVSGALGNNYYLRIRDGKKVYLFSDETGHPMDTEFTYGCEYSECHWLTKPAVCDDGTIFAFGRTAFCEEVKRLNPDKIVRCTPTDIPVPERQVEDRKITLTPCDGKDKVIVCKAGETVSHALENAGIYRLDKCLEGDCGFCRMTLLSGEVIHVGTKVLEAEEKYGIIHPCRAFPKSDITLEYRGKA